MAKQWTLTIRNGPRLQRLHFQSLTSALDALRTRIDELTPQVKRDTVRVFGRRFDPIRQVVVRAEVTGPGRLFSGQCGGIDLRGDGSTEAYTGRFRRSIVELRAGETAYQGLLRALREGAA